jgi:cysteine desulfurase
MATVYLDNNATTLMPEAVISAMEKGCNLGNPSSTVQAKSVVELFRKCVIKLSNLSDEYHVIITSGASESNSTIIHMVADAYLRQSKRAHFVVSSVEHNSILTTLRSLDGLATFSTVAPDKLGFITASSVGTELDAHPDTALAMVMQVNNELGNTNDVRAIGEMCLKHGTPFFVDATQAYGKYPLNPAPGGASVVQGFSFSMHKIYGPPGVGCLVLDSKFAKAYDLRCMIGGAQNGGWRGGTENTCGIAASIEALHYAFTNREEKNDKLSALTSYLIKSLKERGPLIQLGAPEPPGDHIVIMTPPTGRAGPTVLMSIQNAAGKCNLVIKQELLKRGIYVSVGSACNASETKPSHVLEALGVSKKIAEGTIRVSFGDYNTNADIDTFVRALDDILGASFKVGPAQPAQQRS